MSDKYDEMAKLVVREFVCAPESCEDEDCTAIESIAAFGRQCAAEAYKDAAKMTSEEDDGRTKGQLASEFYSKAAAIRGTK